MAAASPSLSEQSSQYLNEPLTNLIPEELNPEQLQLAINDFNSRIEHCNESLTSSYNEINMKKVKIKNLKLNLKSITDKQLYTQTEELINLMENGVLEIEKKLNEVGEALAILATKRDKSVALLQQYNNVPETTSTEGEDNTSLHPTP